MTTSISLFCASALVAGALAAELRPATAQSSVPAQAAPAISAGIVGMWVTADGHIRLELLPNGRYDEARGARKSAYTGRYRVIDGATLHFADDSGFTATGAIADGVLSVGPDRFRKEP